VNVGRIPAEGSLVDHDFPDLVEAVYEKQWTGRLTVTHMGVGKSVIVQAGRLVFASSTSRDDRLGELLLRQGKISLHQYIEAGKLMESHKRLGTILVERGAIAPKELVQGVVEQTREIIFGIFQWTEGRFRLEEGGADSEAITLKISTPELILEGVRRIEAWSRIERGIGGLTALYAAAPRASERLAQFQTSPEKAALVTGMTGPKKIDQICQESSLSHFEVCRTLWAFRVMGLIRRVDVPPPPAKPRVDDMDEGLGSVLEGFGSVLGKDTE
jgi:uncharacterized protein DUF4388